MKPLLVLALVAASLSAYSQTSDSTTGNITGRVTEQNGNPESGATVYAVPQDLTMDGMAPPSVRTATDGTFDFGAGLAWGTYKLFARKDSDAYPNPLDGFYADPQTDAPEINLTERSSSANVTVTLGERAGVITGRVLDSATGAPLKARVAFEREDGAGGHAVTSRARDGEYRMWVPPGKDVIVMVEVSAGHSTGASCPLPHLRVEPGQEIVMDIPVSKP